MKSNKDLYKSAFKNVLPTDNFKEKILASSKNQTKSHKPVKKVTICFVAAIIISLSAVSVYAGVNIYRLYFVENGRYSNTMVLDKSENKDNTLSLDKSHIIKHPKYIKLNIGYLTKGLKPVPTTQNTKYSFDDRYIGGLSMLMYDVSDCEKITITNTDIIAKKTKCINGNDVLYLQEKIYSENTENHPTFDKQFYVYFSEYDYLLQGWVGSDISKKELYKIIKGFSVEECDKENSFHAICKWVEPEDEETVEENYVEDRIIYKDCALKEEVKINKSVSFSVDDLKVSDNLDMMNDDFKKEFLDEKGKIKPLEVYCYGGGDGVNSLDKLQETKHIKLKYIYETVTYTNSSDKDIKDFYIYHQLLHKNYDSIVNNIESLYNKYSVITFDEDFRYKLPEWVYDDFSRSNTNDPNVINIPKNSSVTVHIGFFVPEDEITDDLYLNFDESERRLKIKG